MRTNIGPIPCNFLFSLQNLDSTLSNLDRASRNGFLQARWLDEIYVGKALTLVDFHLRNCPKDLEGLLDKGFSNSLRGVGMLQEGLATRGGGCWRSRRGDMWANWCG